MSAGWMRAAVVAWVLAIGPAVQAGGIGVVGDSYSDEYRFYPPDRSRARNWVEFLAATRGLNFGPLSTTGRGEPRNQGFAHNWARSGATSDDLANSGQVEGILGQIQAGDVDLVVMFIGGNDLINAVESTDPDTAIREATPRAIANVKRAAEAILEARPDVKLVLVTVPDLRDLPDLRDAVRDGHISDIHVRQASNGLQELNGEIRSLGRGNPRVAVADFDLQSRAAKAIGGDAVSVDGRKFYRTSTGDDPDHFFLADRRHIGTVAQALLARLIVDTIDARFDAEIPRVDEPEILRFVDTPNLLRDLVRAEPSDAR